MPQQYDLVIVGAGIAGAIVAKEVARQGKTVLILEAGTGTGLTSEGYQSFVDTYQRALIKVPNSAYPQNPNAPQPYVTDTQQFGTSATNSTGYFVQAGPYPFASTNTRSAGGTTLHWLGTCLRMLPTDFKMKTNYGHGADWPIAYDDMKSFYGRAEEEIGVSADVQDQIDGVPDGDKLYPDNYEYPMYRIPPSYFDKKFDKALTGLTYQMGDDTIDVKVVSTPQGRNSRPNENYRGPDGDNPSRFTPIGAPYGREQHVGERCEGNSSCIPICPVQAKYTAVRSLQTVPQSVASNVVVQTHSVASRVNFHENGAVSGITYKRYTSPDRSNYTTHTAVGQVYVLAAHAIENAKIMMASGGAKTSGALGRHLMDHPTILTFGKMPDPVGSYRGPGSTSGIPSFRDGSFRREHAAFRIEIGNWGWNWATGAPNSTVASVLNPSTPGARVPWGMNLRQQLYDECQRHMRLGLLIEQTPLWCNRVELDTRFVDPLGNFRPVLHYDFDEYTRKGMRAAVEVSNALFDKANVTDFTTFDDTNASYLIADGQPVIAYGAGHIVGTHRMGTNVNNSVTDADMRCWDHQNLFMVGCGSMPTIGTSNPTLTLAALAMKAADAISRELEA